VFLYPLAEKADDVFRPSGFDFFRPSQLRQKAGLDYRPELGFLASRSAALATRSSGGVCAKNSARDITWAETCALAARIFSASFR
jgi:hypothetical protein